MDWKTLSRERAAVGKILDGWQNGTPVSAIERDTVLEKLRRIYELVGAAGTAFGADDDDPFVPYGTFTVTVEGEPGPEFDHEPPVSAEEFVPYGTFTVEVDTFADTEPEPEPRLSPERKPEVVELYADREAKKAVEKVAVEDTPHKKAAKNEETPKAGKTKIDRRALLSLYDDALPAGHPEVESHAEPEPPAEEPAEAWGDVAAGGGRTIADAYAGSVRDVASGLGGGRVESLRDSIGVNDKFRMVRDMFDSDTAAYDRAIERFERFTDLDDAMVYMYENFSWNPDDEGVRLLVDLLTRKLS